MSQSESVARRPIFVSHESTVLAACVMIVAAEIAQVCQSVPKTNRPSRPVCICRICNISAWQQYSRNSRRPASVDKRIFKALACNLRSDVVIQKNKIKAWRNIVIVWPPFYESGVAFLNSAVAIIAAFEMPVPSLCVASCVQ